MLLPFEKKNFLFKFTGKVILNLNGTLREVCLSANFDITFGTEKIAQSFESSTVRFGDQFSTRFNVSTT